MLLGIIIILIVLVNLIVSFSQFNKKRYPQFSKYIDSKGDLKVSAIGSGSGVYAFDFCMMKENAENLCIWPQDFRYDYRMICQYGKLINKDGILFHFFSPLSFAQNEYLNTIEFNEKYLGILPLKMVDVPLWYAVVWKIFPIFVHPKDFVKYLLGRNISKTPMVKICNNTEEIKELAENHLNFWMKSNPLLRNFRDPTQSKFYTDVFDKNIYYLNLIKNYCEKYGIRYIPIIAPISSYIKNSFSEEFLDAFLFDNIKKLEIPYLDFLSKSSYEDITNYLDGLFLNEQARIRFTEEVMKLYHFEYIDNYTKKEN